MGIYAADGSINVTAVDGLSFVGAYAPDGSWNVIDTDVAGLGLRHPCGALRVTVVDGLSVVGQYAADGSLNVIESAGLTSVGFYHPSGAMNVTVVSGAIGSSSAALLTGEDAGMAWDFIDAEPNGFVKDTVTPANAGSFSPDEWWLNAGTSPKLVRGADGYLKWSPHNMLLHSETFDQANWAKTTVTVSANVAVAPNGATTADKLIKDNGTAVSYLQQNSTLIVGATYTWRVRAKAAEWSWLKVLITDGVSFPFAWVNLSTGALGTVNAGITASVESLGNGWYDCKFTFTAAGTGGSFRIYPNNADNSDSTGDGTSGIYIWGAQLNRGTVPTAYLATTTAARFGLAIEYLQGVRAEALATNLLLQSKAFQTTWTAVNVTVTANQITSPQNDNTADLFTASANGWGVRQGATIGSNSTNTFSCFVKKGNATWVQFAIWETAASTNIVRGWFNLDTGAVGSATNGGTATGAAVRMTDFGNGWYRLELSGAVNNAATAVTAQLATANADANTANTLGDTMYAWGAQLEARNFASSFIPTYTVTVTRAADSYNKAVTAVPWSATEGTFYVDTFSAVLPSTTQGIFTIDDGTANELILTSRNIVTNVSVQFNDGGVAQALMNAGAFANSTRGQLTVGWALNDFATSLNGAAAVTDAAGTLPTLTTFRLGSAQAGGAPFEGLIRRVVWVPRKVANGDIPTWRYEA